MGKRGSKGPIRARKPLPPLPKEKLKVCPGGKSNCALCKLSLDDLIYVNNLRVEKKWGYVQISQYLKATFNISPSRNTLADHFLRHLTANLVITQRGRPRLENTPVAKAIDTIPKKSRSMTNDDMETAYTQLTKLARDFTSKVQTIYSLLNLSDKKLKKELKGIDPIKGMEKVAKLSKEARELLKDISSLRAPKVVVAHFLDQAIDRVIYETGCVLSDISKTMQEDLLEAFRTNKTISTDIFTKVFQGAAESYRERMIVLRKEQSSLAVDTLVDLEKLV